MRFTLKLLNKESHNIYIGAHNVGQILEKKENKINQHKFFFVLKMKWKKRVWKPFFFVTKARGFRETCPL